MREQAFTLARRIVEKYPDDPEAHFSQAAIHNRFGDSAAAVAGWKRCLDLNPQSALAYYCLGWDALDHDQPQQAVEYLQQALALDASMGHAQLLLAEALMNTGRTDDAQSPLEAHLRLVPQSVDGHLRLGQVYLQRKQYDRAEQYFLAALEINPQSAAAYDGLVKIAVAAGDESQAGRYRQRLTELEQRGFNRTERRRLHEVTDPAEVRAALTFAHTDVGKVYAAHDEWSEAVKQWKQAAELAPRDVESRQLLVMTYQQAQRPAEAIVYLKELAALEPNNPVHQINLGVLARDAGQTETVEAAFRKVQELLPERHEGYAGLAELYLKTGREPAEIEQLAAKAVELAPIADNYHLLGQAQAKRGDFAAAIAAFEQAVKLGRGNPRYRQSLDQARAQAETQK